MAYHRIYRYTAIGRPLDPSWPSNKAVLVLMPLGAVLGAAAAWTAGAAGVDLLLAAVELLLIVFASWALARELDPDDSPAAFISMAVAVAVALAVADPGILVVFATLGLVRIVNRSTGMTARKSDSVLVVLLVFLVMYSQQSPFFGAVAALAFILDGSLKQPLRHQWIFALLCLGSVREIFGSGTLFGMQLFHDRFQDWVVMILPSGGFFCLAAWLLLFNKLKQRAESQQSAAVMKEAV